MSELKGQSTRFYWNPQKFCVFILASLPYCIVGNSVLCDQSLKNVVYTYSLTLTLRVMCSRPAEIIRVNPGLKDCQMCF